MTGFIPDFKPGTKPPLPYFEDAKGEELIAGRFVKRSLEELKQETITLLARLGGSLAIFYSGKFPGAKAGEHRYGYQIQFQYGSARGRIDIAALPIRTETADKVDRAQAQAVYLLNMELKAMVFAHAYKPGAIPLLPYLIGAGNKTVTEFMIESGSLPKLIAG